VLIRKCPPIAVPVAAALLWCVLAVAAPETGAPLRLEPLVQEVLSANPEIRASQQRTEAALAVVPQARSLPDPKVGIGYRDMPQREAMYWVSQEIPFPGKLGLKGEIAARDAERMDQEAKATQLAVVMRLKEAFFDLHFVHESIEVIGKNKLLLSAFEQTATARYAVGSATQQDVFRAQMEISRLLARLATLEQRRQSFHADINRILNRPPGAPLGTPEETTFSKIHHAPDELFAFLDGKAPLLRARERSLEGSQKAIALARKEFYPDFELDARGMRDTTMRQDGYQVMLNVKVPLYYATKQQEGVRQAVASREATLADLYALRQELLAGIQNNLAQAARAEKLVGLLRDAIIPQSRLTLASAQASYEVGKVDFLTLLNSLLTLQENELELHAEMAEHEKAVARLEGIVGERP
jgi:outer membrane protein TolC